MKQRTTACIFKSFFAATLFTSVFLTIAPASAQMAEGRWLWLSSKSSAPAAGASGSTRGQITVTTLQGASFRLQSFANGTEGFTNTTYQCPELIVRYSSALGFGGSALGNGSEVAWNFAARSGRKFTFQRNGQSAERPYEGAVISISGTDTQGRSFPPPSGQYGHVGIVQNASFSGNVGTVTLFDQNWPKASWKTVTFENRGGAWYGTMTNDPRGGPSQIVDVVGWANPTGAARATPTTPPPRRQSPAPTPASPRQPAVASLPATPDNTLPGRTSEPGSRLPGTSVTISWGAVRGASEYDLNVRDMTSKKALSLDRISRNYYTVKVKSGHTYRWSVKACNATGCSVASERLYFTAQ